MIYDTCPNIYDAMKQKIKENAESQAKKLCKRNGGSILHNKRYTDLEEFEVDNIYAEFANNFPIILELILPVSCSNKDEKLSIIKPKFCMIYSILMGSRWHELSLVKRIITTLLIEGGGSKKVYDTL